MTTSDVEERDAKTSDDEGIDDDSNDGDEIDDEAIVGALQTVIDPEIGIDIVTLGLVYEVHLQGDVVHVVYTLTTPGCPMERVITNGIVAALSRVPGIRDVEPELVFTPRWNPGMAQEGSLW